MTSQAPEFHDLNSSRLAWKVVACLCCVITVWVIGTADNRQKAFAEAAVAAHEAGYREGRESCDEPTRAAIITDAAKGWLLSPPRSR